MLRLSVVEFHQKVNRSLTYKVNRVLIVKIDIDSNFNELFDSLYSRFTTAEAYSIFPDVLGTLKELKHHGFTMGVISNSDERVGNKIIYFLLLLVD
jgi:FMN phosphatase YigB (HAD superfamily)